MAEDWFSGLFDNPWVKAGGTALGAGLDISSFINNWQRQQAIQKIYDTLANPSKLSRYIGGLYQPMSAAQNEAVQRNLGSNWAVMTGGAPGGAQAKFVADALAGIESQRYQVVAQQALEALTGAKSAAGGLPIAPMGAIGGILKTLMALKSIRSGQQTPGLGLPPVGTEVYQGGSSPYPLPVPTELPLESNPYYP